jgi:MFS family permease
MMITLVLLGLTVAMGTIPTLAIMMDLYKARHGEAQSSAANLLVSLFCAAYPLGGWLGITISGAVAESISFRWSTGLVGLLFFLESAACVGFCIAVYRMKRIWRENRMDYSIIAMERLE